MGQFFVYVPKKSYAKVSREKRALLCQTFDQGGDTTSLTQSLEINPHTARGIIYKYRKSGNFEPKKKGGRFHVRISQEMEGFVVSYVESQPDATLKQMKSALADEFKLQRPISESTIARHLDGRCITLKRASLSPDSRNSESTIGKRQNYAQWFLENVAIRELVFIDEMGCNLWTRKSRARSKRGMFGFCVLVMKIFFSLNLSGFVRFWIRPFLDFRLTKQFH